MDLIHYLITPLVGGVIGYVTNDIAIRMLFRPHNAKYLFGFKIPFTPGIIPKEKDTLPAGGAFDSAELHLAGVPLYAPFDAGF